MPKKFLLLFILVLVLWLICPKTTKCYDDSTGIPILMYHNISPKASLTGKYCVSTENFENDLIYIKNNGYTTVSIQGLINYNSGKGELPPKPIVITFDDGYESFYKYAFSLLKKYNCRGVINVVGSFSDLFTKTEDHNTDYSYLTWQEIKELSQSGFVEIGNHTYDMHKLSDRKGCSKKRGEDAAQYTSALVQDAEMTQARIKDFTGSPSLIFAYPYGSFSEETPDIIKSMGYEAILTCTEEINHTDKEGWLFKLGRFNRPNGMSTETFFSKIEKSRR